LIEKLNRPGYIGSIIAAAEAEDAKWVASSKHLIEGPEPEDETLRQRRAETLAVAELRRSRSEALAGFLKGHPTADSIIDCLRDSDRRRREWRAAVRERVAAERLAVLAHDPESPIPDEAWQALKLRLRQDAVRLWTFRWVERGRASHHVSFEEIENSAYAGQRAGIRELVADYYVDANARALIPPAALAELEPYWRSLSDNRPHRMGGYHDGVQSDAQPGPVSELLLFQIATDNGMHWCWGDCGAYYVFLAPEALKARDFSKATMVLECY
jgi:hypothetical protein